MFRCGPAAHAGRRRAASPPTTSPGSNPAAARSCTDSDAFHLPALQRPAKPFQLRPVGPAGSQKPEGTKPGRSKAGRCSTRHPVSPRGGRWVDVSRDGVPQDHGNLLAVGGSVREGAEGVRGFFTALPGASGAGIVPGGWTVQAASIVTCVAAAVGVPCRSSRAMRRGTTRVRAFCVPVELAVCDQGDGITNGPSDLVPPIAAFLAVADRVSGSHFVAGADLS